MSKSNSKQTQKNSLGSLFKMFDDIAFITTLLGCIQLGSYYKSITDTDMRKNYGVGLGLIVAILLCRTYILHAFVMIWGNCVIIKYCDRSYVHKISLSWTWMYLLFIHLNLKSLYTIWFYQNLALRLVGLAFEVHQSKDQVRLDGRITLTSNEAPTSTDVVSYAFFFIGIHKGPYYKWQIYKDHLRGSFGNLGDCSVVTQQKLSKAFFCAILYIIIRMQFSPYIYYESYFYKNYNTETRYLYNIPVLVMYFLKNQILMLLCTCVCTEAGFGVYPVKCLAEPGQGPTNKLSLLLLLESPSLALEQEYNFAMLKCFDNGRIFLGPLMSDTLRGWDLPTQYWFYSYIYQGLIKGHKEVRGIISFMAWSLWCAPTLQYLLIFSTIWVYIHIESEYSKHYRPNYHQDSRSGLITMKTSWNFGFSIMRLFCLIYLTPCLVVPDTAVVFKYYCSIYWVYHIILVVLIIGALGIHRSKYSR